MPQKTMKELSPNNKLLKSTLPILLTVVGVIVCAVLFNNNLLILFSGLLLVGAIGFFVIRNIYNKTENIFYDTQFLYLKNGSETRKVELTDIKRVKLTLTDQRVLGMQYYKYRIEFTSGKKSIDTIIFWTSGINARIDGFEKHLAYYAPKTEIEHFASTFDY